MKNSNTLDVFQNRVELLVGANLKSENRVKQAANLQDSIRSKIKTWNGAQEIRRWREKEII